MERKEHQGHEPGEFHPYVHATPGPPRHVWFQVKTCIRQTVTGLAQSVTNPSRASVSGFMLRWAFALNTSFPQLFLADGFRSLDSYDELYITSFLLLHSFPSISETTF